MADVPPLYTGSCGGRTGVGAAGTMREEVDRKLAVKLAAGRSYGLLETVVVDGRLRAVAGDAALSTQPRALGYVVRLSSSPPRRHGPDPRPGGEIRCGWARNRASTRRQRWGIVRAGGRRRWERRGCGGANGERGISRESRERRTGERREARVFLFYYNPRVWGPALKTTLAGWP